MVGPASYAHPRDAPLSRSLWQVPGPAPPTAAIWPKCPWGLGPCLPSWRFAEMGGFAFGPRHTVLLAPAFGGVYVTHRFVYRSTRVALFAPRAYFSAPQWGLPRLRLGIALGTLLRVGGVHPDPAPLCFSAIRTRPRSNGLRGSFRMGEFAFASNHGEGSREGSCRRHRPGDMYFMKITFMVATRAPHHATFSRRSTTSRPTGEASSTTNVLGYAIFSSMLCWQCTSKRTT